MELTKPPLAAAPESAPPKLARSLGVGGNVLITLSSISPASSVFILGGAALASFGTGVFWAFAIAGVVSILIAFCYADLASSYPVAGGDYSLVSRAIGPSFGVATFFINLISLPLILAVFGVGVADYLGVAIQGLSPVATGIVVVALATLTACFNIRTNAWLTGVFLFIEFAALALLTVLGLVHIERSPLTLLSLQFLDPSTNHLAPLTIAGLVIAVTQGIFAYNGYGGAVYFSEETKNATRAIAKAVLWSAIITILAEIVPLAAIILGASSLNGLFGAALPVEAFLTERSGSVISTIVLLAIALAIVNAIIAIALQAGRLLYTAARDNALPAVIARPLSRVTPRSHVPVTATVVMGAIGVLACLIPIDVLLTATGSTLAFTYLFIAVAALTNRRKPKPAGAYTMPLWPLPPALAVVALGAIFVISFSDPAQWTSLAISVGLVLAGFVYYSFYLRPRKATHLLLADASTDDDDDDDPARAETTGANR
ncbi:APC family permease [Diaminobutyricibacter sp. McL0618]|uniref:APC family permease n=1 Tax=Leifsonia sp. McL0618 TaxID=3415677 RepID=UPI003CEAE629